MMTSLAFVPFLSLCAATASGSTDLEGALKRVVDAHGGAKALERAAAFRAAGTMTATRHGGESGKFVREMRGESILKVANHFEGKEDEIRILKGPEGWRAGVKVTGMPLAAMKLQAGRLAMPLNLWKRRKDVRDGGTVQRDGKRYQAFELTLDSGLELRAEVDPATHRIVRSVGTIEKGAHRVDFITDYSDYRKVEGALFAFQEERTIMGVKAASVTLQKVEILDPNEEIKL